jgi:hypothetical protein
MQTKREKLEANIMLLEAQIIATAGHGKRARLREVLEFNKKLLAEIPNEQA